MNIKTGKKTIMLLISGLGPGGAERIFHTLAVELSKNYRVVECVYNLEGQVYPFATNEHHILTPKVAANVFEKLIFMFLRIYRLWKLKRLIRPDICISQLESSDYLNLLTRQKKEKCICLIQCSMIFNDDIAGRSGWLRKNILMPMTYRKADAIVSVSSGIKTEFQQYFHVAAEKIHVVYNFIDAEVVKRKSLEPLQSPLMSIFASDYCFITAGRLTKQKNQAALLSVFATLKSQYNQSAKLFLLGDGELREDLIILARQKGQRVYSVWESEQISKDYDVYFLGFDKNPFKFISQAKWFIFSSLWEGLPLVLVEAMAAGTPIISSDCPTGPSDILGGYSDGLTFTKTPVDARYGVLMPMISDLRNEREIEIWCKKLISLMSDDNIRLNFKKGNTEALSQFTTSFAIKQWHELIESYN